MFTHIYLEVVKEWDINTLFMGFHDCKMEKNFIFNNYSVICHYMPTCFYNSRTFNKEINIQIFLFVGRFQQNLPLQRNFWC